MAPKIFITGITGYIGGDAAYAVHKAHPDYEYSALVRTQEKADTVKKAYPSFRFVLGDLDSYDIIKDEAAKADIVIHTADASDHEGAAKAIAEGLVAGHSKENPGYWLHIGGTGIFTYDDSNAKRFGEHTDKVYNDWEGIDELTHLPDEAFHRNVDKVVIETGTKHADSVKTTIVCPPTIFGQGRGPVNGRSRQAYELTKLILEKKFIPVTGQGKARWNNVHVHDLCDVFILLVDAAAAKSQDPDLWGAKGYLIIEAGEHNWADLAKLIGKTAAEKGYISQPETKSLSYDEAYDVAGFQAISWGLNSRAKTIRATKVLGWKPSRGTVEKDVPNIIEAEHQLMAKSS